MPKAPVPREAPISAPGSTTPRKAASVVPPKAQTPTPQAVSSSRPRRSQKKFVREKDKIKVSSSFKNAAKQQIKVNPNSPGKRVRSPVDRFKPTDGNYFLDLIQNANAFFRSSTGLSSSSSQGSTLSSSPQGSTSSSFQVANVPTTLSRVVSTRTSHHQKLHQLIAKKYGNPSGKQWKIPSPIENDCPLEEKAGEAKIANLTPTQFFLTKYFTPESPQKGMLLWHSTGTGKTCTAISIASAEFERQEYRVIWVTRKSLRSDVVKNIYGENICHHRIDPNSQVFKNNKEYFKTQLAKQRGEISKQFKNMSNSWGIEPMTHKQFANFCKGGMVDIQKQFASSAANLTDGRRRKPLNLNLTSDIFYKTLIIIDEAHYLYSSGGNDSKGQPNPALSDIPPWERIYKDDVEAIEKKIKNSYAKSGKNSARVLLMTATPIQKHSDEFFSLINLCKEDRDIITEADKQIVINDKRNWLEFIDKHLSGYISYLDRSKDPTQFAQVVSKSIYVNMDDNLKNLILTKCYGQTATKTPKSPKTPKEPKAPKSPKSPGRVGGKNTCKKCGGTGHYAKTCKNPPKQT